MAGIMVKLLGRLVGQDLGRFDGATKVHDVEARWRDPDRRTIAKINQNIWDNGLGNFRVKIRRWPGPEVDSPLELWVNGGLLTSFEMSGATLRDRHPEPMPAGIPKLKVGDRIELRRGTTQIETRVEED